MYEGNEKGINNLSPDYRKTRLFSIFLCVMYLLSIVIAHVLGCSW